MDELIYYICESYLKSLNDRDFIECGSEWVLDCCVDKVIDEMIYSPDPSIRSHSYDITNTHIRIDGCDVDEDVIVDIYTKVANKYLAKYGS